ncbi:MAG TPA: replicative DNA helicase [Pyrinomonadaceae bacterium]|jgi:replicative DNA helicase
MARNFADPPREQMLERPLPHSADAERAILGAIILDNGLVNQAIELLRPDDFYQRAHQLVFRAMIGLSERGSEINPILLGEELRREGWLEQTGGVAAISELTYGLPHFSNLAAYAKVVKDKSLLRQLVRAANKVIAEALEEEDEAEIILDHAEQAIFALADERTRQGFTHIKPVAETILEKVQEMSGRNIVLTGLTTGFTELDQMTSGLQPSDLVIIAARPSMGKCLAFDSEILLADGRVATIEEIYNAGAARLLTLGDDLKFRATAPSHYVDDGRKPVFRVTTRLGRVVETTLSHPFLTLDGWQPLGRLRPGVRVAVPRALPVFGGAAMRECEVKLLAYLLGDGCLTSSSPVFTVGKPALRDDFARAVSAFGGVETRPANSHARTFSLRIRKQASHNGRTNPVTHWLRELGVYGRDSHAKFIPAPVFQLPREQLALFLNRLFATDGWATVLASGPPQLGFASVSERLARQVQHLLLRFGVIAALKRRQVKYSDTRRTAWQLDITDLRSIRTFVEEIGIHGKERALAAVREALAHRRQQTNRDLIPLAVWPRIAALKGAESWASLARRAGFKCVSNIHAGRRAPTRPRLLALAEALDSAELRRLATSDVYWDEIVAVEPAGVKQVYDLTIPETHNFVANDVCVHNTSLCLTLAQNAAIQAGAVVGVFSLEMSKESLVMRMLCSEGHVDAHRFRSGFLNREEWGRLAQALGSLAEARIYIDDTPGISVLEMRAKARRLAAEQKRLDLIIVDYLQLMSGSSRRTESRQQEVSQISRELKGLAKELNVPLVALSQLSRAPEARSDHRPQLSDLRESGCLTGDSLVTLADTGARVPIRDLVGQSGFAVWALDERNWHLKRADVSRAFATGVKPVYRLETRLGRALRATANHKFLTFDGWKRLDELRVGERLALPRIVPEASTQTMTDAELALLGHLIGDGCTLPRHAIQYTTRERDLAETVAALAAEAFGAEVAPRIRQEQQWYQVYLASTRRHTHGVRSAVAEWLTGLGAWGLRSYEKFVPAKVFEQPRAAVALFLRHLWATDGCIRMKPGFYPPAVYYASSSERLARDVQTLLLRLGINAWLRRRSQQGKGRDQYHVAVAGKHDLELFGRTVGAVGEYKNRSLQEVLAYLAGRTAQTNRDIIPHNVWRSHVVPAMQAAGITTREMLARIDTAYCGTRIYQQNVSRARAAKIAAAVESAELADLARSDVYWDELVSVQPDGVAEVFDLTVPGPHNFIANDIIAHNSIEQDADLVAFIFREEQYNRTEENAGLAEIIIAKQRNGPTGTVKLAFLKEFTRFENLFRETDHYLPPSSGSQLPPGSNSQLPPKSEY